MFKRIDTAFGALKESKKTAFIPFTVLGYPNKQTSIDAVEAMIENGATVLELGFPFSDPMADGPIIENASKAMVESGFTTDDALEIIATIRERYPNIPIVVLTYFNLAFARGVETFLDDLKNAGVDGITFVDLPVEECREVYDYAAKIGLAPVMLVSPLTTEERLKRILEFAAGYIYLVSRAGITGLSESFDDRLRTLVSNIQKHTELPVCIGFGISKPEHVHRMISAGADGVIVGSKIVELLSNSNTAVRSIGEFTRELSAGNASHRQPPERRKLLSLRRA